MNVKIPLPNADDLPEKIRAAVSSSPLNVVKMMANAPGGLSGLLRGENFGKQLVHIAD